MPEDLDRRQGVFVSERPWGRFQQLATNEPCTVKIITVNPGQRLSLQRHEHRAEMWQLLEGVLDITLHDRTWRAAEDELIWVPQRGVHRVANPTTAPVRILEIAFGPFDEEDIERLEDDYSRA